MIRLGLLCAIVALPGIASAAEPAPGATELALVDMTGQKQVLGTVPSTVFSPRVSPDGRRVVFELADGPQAAGAPASTRLFVADLRQIDQRRPLPLTLHSTRNLAAVWSPEGDHVVFMASGNGADALYLQRADGSVQPRFVVEGRAPEGWYKGGRIAFITRAGEHDYGISAFDPATGKATRLVDLPGSDQHSSRISPDGRWIAYASTETGRQEVWIEPLPQTGQRTQLTTAGGRHPVWSPDGGSLYFDQGGGMYRLDLAFQGGSVSAGAPVALPISGFLQGELRRQFDLMPDGRSFLMLFPAAPK